jgi:hypothetical protein
MDMADGNGAALRRRLASADLFRDAAISRGLVQVNTPASRSKALLVEATCRDHTPRNFEFRPAFRLPPFMHSNYPRKKHPQQPLLISPSISTALVKAKDHAFLIRNYVNQK